MGSYLRLHNCRLLDPAVGFVQSGHEVLVEDDKIVEVSDRPLKASAAVGIDCRQRTLMPGLIDCHVHACLSEVDVTRLEHLPVSSVIARAASSLAGMLKRGFTTVRDAAGADWGLKDAVEKGLFPGPRLFISGRAIGQTGGHSDMRRRTAGQSSCRCCDGLAFTMAVADGAGSVRATVREEIRQGADAIKIMVSGGVASPHDPLDSRQFSTEEIRAAVEEAQAFGKYVLAHAYTPDAINRAVREGVRTIEHGNLINDECAALLAERGAYLVANLVAYVVMKERAAQFGMSPEKLAKNEVVLRAGFESLEICQRAGVKVGFGSDLLGQLQDEQSREFTLRREVLSSIEILRSATTVGAEIVRMDGKLGAISPGAFADMLLINGDPIEDISVLEGQGERIDMIMQGGRILKNALH